MKKKLVYFTALLSLFFTQTNILANQTIDDNEAIQSRMVDLKKTAKEADSKKNINSSNANINETIHDSIDKMSDLSKLTIRLKDNKYYVGNKLVKNSSVSKTESGNSITLKYCQGRICLSSDYKKIDKDKGYAHEKNTYVITESIYNEESNKKEKIIETYIYLFDYNASKYTKTNDLIGGNATDNYRVKSSTNKMVYSGEELIMYIKYQKKDRKLSLFNYAEMTYKEKNKLVMTMKSYITRYSNNSIKNSKSYFYNPSNRLVMSQHFIYKKNQYDPEEAEIKTVKITSYDAKKRITSYYILESTKDNMYEKYKEYRSYHKNGKLKRRTIYKRNAKNKLTKSTKVNYRTNGKRSNYKKRSYKKGIVSRQYYYQYNKYGLLKTGSKRTTITYNKKGKAIKASVAKYNKKGKLNKGKVVKVTKNNKKW